MKPKLQELEELVESQDLEAIAEQEGQPTFSPYRTDEDISYKLDVPRDVNGLLELLEERRNLEITIIKIQNEKFPYSFYYGTMGMISGFLAGSLPGAALLTYVCNSPNDPHNLRGLGSLLILIGALFGTAYVEELADNYRTIKSSARKKFDQEKAQKIQELQEKIQPLAQKLSRYETRYTAGDILFLNDTELKYCLGDVVVEKEERVLHQKYITETEHDGYRFFTRTKAINPEEIISILHPEKQLNVDDLLSLDTHTPVLWKEGVYGFFQRKDQEHQFVVSTQLGRYIPERMRSYSFQQIEGGEITPRLLVPEMKQNPLQNYRVKAE